MQTIKFICRRYTVKKTGVPFVKLTVLGKFLPLALADDETEYLIKFTKDSCAEPTKDGVYEVAYEDNGLWIDTRPEQVAKNIVRIKAHKVVFVKSLAYKLENESK